MKITNKVSKNINVLKSTQLCGLTGVRLQLAVLPVQYERRIVRAGFCGSFMPQWLWQLQSDTLGSSLVVTSFLLFSFLPGQVDFGLNLHNNLICISIP